jgi:hypothetical protein
MNVQDILYKIKSRMAVRAPQGGETVSFDEQGHIRGSKTKNFLFWGMVLVLVATFFFGVGRLTAITRRPEVKVTFDPTLAGLTLIEASSTQGSSKNVQTINNATVINSAVSKKDGSVFASSKGKKYYYTGCKSTIVEKNKITFASKELAESAGYTLAVTCKPK